MNKKIIIIIVLFWLFLPNIQAQLVQLDRCIDGDTARFFTDKGSEAVRFLAIDTPELRGRGNQPEPFAVKASDFTCEKLNFAQEIRLEFDENSDRYDRYDRLLAWIFVDDVLLQELIIEAGLGEVAYLYGDYKYTELLQLKEAVAKKNQVGIWSQQSDLEVFKISILTIAFMSLVNLVYFNFNHDRKSYLNKIYQNKNIYLKILLIGGYIITVVLVIHDFAIITTKLAKYKKKVRI